MDLYAAFIKKQVRNYLFGSSVAVMAAGSLLMFSTLDVSGKEYGWLLLILAVSFLVMIIAEMIVFRSDIRPIKETLRSRNPELPQLRQAYKRTHQLPLLAVRRILVPHLLGLMIPGVTLAVLFISLGIVHLPLYYVGIAVAGSVLIASMHALIEFFLTGTAISPLVQEFQKLAIARFKADFSVEEHVFLSIRPKFLVSCMLIGTFPLFLFSMMTQVRMEALSTEAIKDYWIWAGLVLFIGIGFSTLAAWLLTRSVQRPIDQLHEAINRVKEGRLVQAQDLYSDEFSRLVAGFNMMVRGLQVRERQNRQLLDSYFTTLALALDARDSYTAGHSLRVAEYSVIIGRMAGLTREQLDNLRKSALLHDIGKIGVSDHVLFKEGQLTDEEFDQIKSHPVLGESILLQIEPPEAMAPYLGGVRSHHERYDGRGYPDGLAGEDIPLFGRVIAVADAYDAMTSDRPYRKGMEHERALNIIREGRGTQWDPEFAALLLSYFEQKTAEYLKDYPVRTG
ncbi:HD domain-containing phosphohydrolase [Paenibacillus sp. CN-4]|uniref:HD domain-containing phosphohydrolase n=1 Tax=Paenibacillus nanchangensis TaxID=3348343 RepID=UPI00397D9910